MSLSPSLLAVCLSLVVSSVFATGNVCTVQIQDDPETFLSANGNVSPKAPEYQYRKPVSCGFSAAFSDSMWETTHDQYLAVRERQQESFQARVHRYSDVLGHGCDGDVDSFVVVWRSQQAENIAQESSADIRAEGLVLALKYMGTNLSTRTVVHGT